MKTGIAAPLGGAAAILGALCLAACVAAFVLPACAAIGAGFPAAQAQDAAGGTGYSGAARILSALRFTVVQALLSTVVAVLVGLPAAFLAARRDFPGRRVLLSLSGVPLCVPPAIIALAFVLFYGRQGVLNVFLMRAFSLSEPPVTFLYSLAGVVIAHGFYDFPVVMRTVAQVWERLPREEEDAARLLGAGRFRVFRTITLPQVSGAILGSASLVFLYCFFSFVIVLLFGGVGGTTLEVELYQAARSELDFARAGRIAALETGAALGLVWLYALLQRRLSAGAGERTALRPRSPLRGMALAAAGFYFAFLCLGLVAPLLAVLARSFVAPGAPHGAGAFAGGGFGFGTWAMLFARRGFIPALRTTVGVAFAVTAVSTAAALFLALAQDLRPARPGGSLPGNSSRRGLLSRVLPFAPLAVSSVVLGFGWNILVPRGNLAALVLAQSALAWPFAWTQIRTGLDRIPAGVDSAAILLSRGRIDAAFRVRVPLARRGILAGAAFVFAISAGDATLPLVLSLPRFENLSLMLFRLAGSYRFGEACACATVLMVLCGLVFAFQETKNG